jgi:hypothetical protein
MLKGQLAPAPGQPRCACDSCSLRERQTCVRKCGGLLVEACQIHYEMGHDRMQLFVMLLVLLLLPGVCGGP